MTSYNKSTYYKEADNLLTEGYAYYFGNGKDKLCYYGDSDIYKNAANAILAQISTQICRDLSFGARKDDPGCQRFHIIQSNVIGLNGLFDCIPSNVKYIIHANYGQTGQVYIKPHINGEKQFNGSDIRLAPIAPIWHWTFKIGDVRYILSCFSIK